MKKYISLVRIGILEQIAFRMGLLATIAGNLIYIIIVYFLWKSIFLSVGDGTVGGMTFTQTIVYIVLAGALFYSMEVYLVWDAHRSIQSGKVINNLIKPIPYRMFLYFPYFGSIIVLLLTTFVPTFIVVYFLVEGEIRISINVLFFAISVILAVFINMNIDYFVSCILFYTQSTFGINIMKEVIVLLLSGATIPIAFFPEPLKSIVMYLPFQAIYNSPLVQLNNEISLSGRFEIIGVQLVWVFVTLLISEVFFKKSITTITVNGG